jgi:hypothetical protein
MKKVTNVRLVSLLSNMDSNQLKELRKEFNTHYSNQMHDLDEKERVEILEFIDGLSLDRHWNETHRNVVSLKRYSLPREQGQKLNTISDTISRAFNDLMELKREVAQDCRRDGIPNHRRFTTTVRRMNKFKANDS